MSAYKDKTQGTWYVSFRYIDWTGKKTQKLKRGFKTKKEALNYEKEFIRKTAADMKMEMNSFIQVYFEDKKNESAIAITSTIIIGCISPRIIVTIVYCVVDTRKTFPLLNLCA